MSWSNYTHSELIVFLQNSLEENTKLKVQLVRAQNAKSILFADYLQEWLENRRSHLQPLTYLGYAKQINKHIDPYFRQLNASLEDLSVDMLAKYYSYLLDIGLSANTVKHHHANIRMCLQNAVKNDLMVKNPAVFVELPRLIKSPVKYLSPEQLLCLLKAIRYHKIYPVVLLCCIELRRSEAIAVSIEVIQNNVLTICRKAMYIPKLGVQVTDMLKNQSSYRDLVIPTFILSKLFWAYNRKLEYMEQNFDKYTTEYRDFFALMNMVTC